MKLADGTVTEAFPVGAQLDEAKPRLSYLEGWRSVDPRREQIIVRS